MLRTKQPISQIFYGLSSDKIFLIKTDCVKFRKTYNSQFKIVNPVRQALQIAPQLADALQNVVIPKKKGGIQN